MCFQNVSSGLVELIKPAMQESMVPEFIWRHLDKDISLLAKSLGKSTDESLLAIHMILRGIAQKDIPKGQCIVNRTRMIVFYKQHNT